MQCTSPVFIPHVGSVPCGKCLSCRISKSREWSARLLHELSYWNSAVFITLTYDDFHLPKNNSLVKSDLQKFFKRLRSYSNAKIKYFACGEYGDNKRHVDYGTGQGRPHYHAIIFGLSSRKRIDRQFVKDCWHFCDWNMLSDKKCFGSVTYDSCRYVSDYIFKKYSKELAKSVYLDKGIEVPFKICSQGLGLRYCLDERANLSANMGFTLHGSRMALPRYYVKKLGLKLEHSGEAEELAKWQHYADTHDGYFYASEPYFAHMKQRALNVERRSELFHKGKL